MNKALLLTIAALMLLATIQGALADSWYNSSWDYRVKVTVQSSKVPSTQSDFPVYVDLSDVPAGALANMAANCTDVRVTMSDGTTELPREVVFCNSTAGELHFKGNLSSSTDTVFYIYYGNAAASEPAVGATYGRNAVWSDYAGVFHLGEATGSYTDSTGNQDGTAHGNLPTQSTGKLSEANDFDGSEDYISVTDNAVYDLTNAMTVTAWIKPDDVSNYNLLFTRAGAANLAATWNNKVHGYAMRINSDGTFSGSCVISATEERATSTGTLSVGSWQFVGMSYDGSNVKTFISGSNDGTHAASGTIDDTSDDPWIGIGEASPFAFDYDGDMEELRICSLTRSEDWLTTEYNNQNSPSTFYTVGSQEERNSVVVVSVLPVDNDHLNDDPVVFSFNTTSTNNVNCTLYMNETANQTLTNLSDGTHAVNVSAAEGAWEWNVSCSDGSVTGSSGTRTVVVDRTNPLWSIGSIATDNSSVFNIDSNELLHMNDYVEDTYLFAYNVTFCNATGYCAYENSTTGLMTSRENFTQVLNMSSWTPGNWTAHYEATDDHTAKEIPVYAHTKSSQGIVFSPPSGTVVGLEAVEGNLVDVTTKKLSDRYTFSIDWGNARQEHEIVLYCNEPLFYRGALYEWPTFVCGAHWIDFVPDRPVADVRVKKLSPERYSLNFVTEKKGSKIGFSSLGGLNTVEEEYGFIINDPPTLSGAVLNSTDGLNRTNGTLMGWVTPSDTDDATVSLYWLWWKNAAAYGYGISTPTGYHEEPNPGSNNTGGDAWTDSGNAVDDDYGTYSNCLSGTCYYYINYTLEEQSVGATWEVAFTEDASDRTNVTITDDCWSANNNIAVLRVEDNNTAEIISAQCQNNTAWRTLYSVDYS